MKGFVRVGIAAAIVVGLLGSGAASALASTTTTAALVKDIAPGAVGSDPEGLIEANGTLFFAANVGVHGDELWKSDGTTAGTTLVKDINPGAGSSIGNGACTYFIEGTPFAAIKGTLFFAADDGVHGCELWKSDGTASGTSLVADINPGPAGSYPGSLIDFHGRLFISADDGVHGREPWMSDGTPAGTHLLRDIISGGDGFGDGFHKATAVDDLLFFFVEDYDADSEELWRTDGSAAGTAFVAKTTCVQCDHDTYFQRSFNGLAIISVRGGCCGFRLHLRSDGTPEGTFEFERGQSYGNWAMLNGSLYFFDHPFDSGEGNAELWRSDATVAGTTKVTDITPGIPSDVSSPTVVNGQLLFFRFTFETLSLWATGGTAESTSPLFDVGPLDTDRFGYTYGLPYWTTVVGNSLFFVAAVGGSGYELWTTDGTAAGTYLVRDINPGEGDSFYLPHYGPDPTLSAVDGTLFFNADDGVHGHELWKTTPPLRSAYKNASRYCNALRASSADGYKNHGQCVSGNH